MPLLTGAPEANYRPCGSGGPDDRRIASILVLHFAFATASWAQSSWTPMVDTYGSSRAQYLSRDMVECRGMAQQAGGAAMGAVLGNAGRGAALGAIGGGVTRGVRQTSASDAAFQQAFSNCLRARGHNVIN